MKLYIQTITILLFIFLNWVQFVLAATKEPGPLNDTWLGDIKSLQITGNADINHDGVITKRKQNEVKYDSGKHFYAGDDIHMQFLRNNSGYDYIFEHHNPEGTCMRMSWLPVFKSYDENKNANLYSKDFGKNWIEYSNDEVTSALKDGACDITSFKLFSPYNDFKEVENTASEGRKQYAPKNNFIVFESPITYILTALPDYNKDELVDTITAVAHFDNKSKFQQELTWEHASHTMYRVKNLACEDIALHAKSPKTQAVAVGNSGPGGYVASSVSSTTPIPDTKLTTSKTENNNSQKVTEIPKAEIKTPEIHKDETKIPQNMCESSVKNLYDEMVKNFARDQFGIVNPDLYYKDLDLKTLQNILQKMQLQNPKKFSALESSLLQNVKNPKKSILNTWNRDAVVGFAIQSAGLNLSEKIHTFADIKDTDDFAKEIQTAYDACIVHGRDTINGLPIAGQKRYFQPKSHITTAEFIKVIFNLNQQ